MEKIKQDKMEITIKELIVLIFTNSKTIAKMTFAAVIITAILLFFVIPPIYETETKFFINISEDVVTEVGLYHYPSNHIHDYSENLLSEEVVNETIKTLNLDFKYDEFVKSLVIINDTDSSVMKVRFRSEDYEKNSIILDKHVSNFFKYINSNLRKDAIGKFINEKNVKVVSETDNIKTSTLKLNETKLLLENTPRVITLQKSLISDLEYATIYANSKSMNLGELFDDMMVEEVVNSNYVTLETQINDLKKSISNSEIEVERLSNEIEYMKTELNRMVKEDIFTANENNFLKTIEISNQVISHATVFKNKVFPNRGLILGVTSVLYLLAATFIVLIGHYWKKSM